MIQTRTKGLYIYSGLVFLYICSIGFQTIIDLPYLGKKLQLPEIFFLSIFIYLGFDSLKNKAFPFSFQVTLFDKIIFLYPLVVFISSAANSSFHSWLEFVGVVYLYVAYFFVKTILSKCSLSELYDFFYSAFMWGGFLLGVSCWAGWGMIFFSGESENAMAFIYEKYPYFGDVIRANGFTPSPHMVASILNISIVFFFSKVLFKKIIPVRDYFFMGVILIAYVMTLAKIVVLLFLGIGLLFYKKNEKYFTKTKKWLLGLSYGFAIVFYLFAVHFLVIKKANLEGGQLKKEHFHSGYIFAETNEYIFVPSTYAALKKSAFFMGKNNPILGVGLGNHEFQLDELREKNIFPKHLENYPPHSTYFGGFAELGIIGLGVILFIFISIWKNLKRMMRGEFSILNFVFFVIFFIAFVEAISTDILNFRHYWILLAGFSVVLSKKH